MQTALPTRNGLPDTCARCGAPFRCGAKNRDDKCWCSEMPPLEPLPGRSCLCRECLELELRERT
ncbi:MAG TPA: cysteine-rich CWC family protein [Burkholderiales bacterium]|nr:cysteine-rich CWC family protein [Burkholderiales bacterium]